MFGFGQAGHENDRNVLGGKIGFQAAGDFEAIHARHQRVEQDDVGQALPGALQGGFAMRGDEHGVAAFVEGIVQQGEVFRDVIDDQDDVGERGVKPVHGAFS